MRNAAAIGYNAITTQTNDMVIGNNYVHATIGLSGVAPGLPTRLEISTANGVAPYPVLAGGTPPAYVNNARGTGWSGLRFDDLTALSTPGINPGPGVLAVDSVGNVIYIIDTGKAGIGYCPILKTLTSDGGYDLNTHNFYFKGNYQEFLIIT